MTASSNDDPTLPLPRPGAADDDDAAWGEAGEKALWRWWLVRWELEGERLRMGDLGALEESPKGDDVKRVGRVQAVGRGAV